MGPGHVQCNIRKLAEIMKGTVQYKYITVYCTLYSISTLQYITPRVFDKPVLNTPGTDIKKLKTLFKTKNNF